MNNADLLKLAEHWESQCNRYVNGVCNSAACMRRGGYTSGDPVDDYVQATCPEHETAAALRASSERTQP